MTQLMVLAKKEDAPLDWEFEHEKNEAVGVSDYRAVAYTRDSGHRLKASRYLLPL